jgi:hypothetical protein
MPFGEGGGDLAVEKILAHRFRLPQQWVAEPAGTGLFVNDQRILSHRPGDLSRQRAALVADLDEIAR